MPPLDDVVVGVLGALEVGELSPDLATIGNFPGLLIGDSIVESLAIEVGRRLTSKDVIRVLAGLMLQKGVPAHIRSDNGSEFVAKAIREWLDWERRRCSSSREAPGRTDTSRASTGSWWTSC